MLNGSMSYLILDYTVYRQHLQNTNNALPDVHKWDWRSSQE